MLLSDSSETWKHYGNNYGKDFKFFGGKKKSGNEKNFSFGDRQT